MVPNCLQLSMQVIQDRFQPGLQRSSVPGLTTLDFGQDSQSVGTGYIKTPNLMSRGGKGVVGTTSVFVDKPEGMGF